MTNDFIRFRMNQSIIDGDYFIYDNVEDFQFPTLPEGECEIFNDYLNKLDKDIQLLMKHGKRLLHEKRNKEEVIKLLEKQNKELKEKISSLEQFIEEDKNKRLKRLEDYLYDE